MAPRKAKRKQKGKEKEAKNEEKNAPVTPLRKATEYHEPGRSDAGTTGSGDQENAALEEKQLPLAGPPMTPEKNVIQNLISPKLRKSISIDTIQPISSPSVLQDMSPDEEQLLKSKVVQLEKAFLRVAKDQRQAEADLERATETIATLDAAWKEGECDLSVGDFEKERQRMLSIQLQLLTTVAFLRTAGAQLAGRWTDDLAIGQRETFDDWAYIGAAIRCYPELAKAKKTVKPKRTQQKQKKFHGDLIRAYGSECQEEGTFWCPVAHEYVLQENITAAHVVNCNIGEKTTQALFGDDQEHIWNVKNGIILSEGYEQLLDTAKAVILPASSKPNENEFVFYLLEKDLGRKRAPVWSNALHGRKLSFKTDFRPSRRYLYFKFVISILRRRRAEVPGFELDVPDLPSPAKTLWASPGPYMKKPILYKFSRQLGCMTVEEANRFWDVPSPPSVLEVESEDRTTTLATLSCSAIGAEDAERVYKGSSDSDGFDDSEDDDSSFA